MIEIKNLKKSFGELEVLKGIDLTVSQGEVISIIGFDGELAGKQAILEGKIYADPIQFPKQMGQGIIEKLIAYQAGEEYEKTTLIPTALYKKEDAEKDPELQAAN